MNKKIFLYILILFGVASYGQENKQVISSQLTSEKINILKSEEGNILLEESASKEKKPLNATENLNSGIGETLGTLSVSLSGAANYDIPIAVPPGINGVAPKISLSYSSHSGNGIAGYGWDVKGVSVISRIAATKYHDNIIDGVDFDAYDRFALNGKRLILKSGTYGANGAEYETENYSNLRIISHGVSPFGASYGPSYFTVLYPDGSKAKYGHTNDSRTHGSYAITYWENPQGVRINYEYIKNGNSQSISKIKYGHINSNAPINEVRFLYVDRLRLEQTYIKNELLTRNNLLQSIQVYANNERLRVYSLHHDNTDNLNYNRLTILREHSGDYQEAHSAIHFDYTTSASSVNYNAITADIGLANIEQRNTETFSLDLTGNGKMDFIAYPKENKTKFWLFKDIQSGQNVAPWVINTGEFETIFPTISLNHQNRILGEQGLTIVSKGNNGQVHFKVHSNGVTGALYHQYTKTWNSPTYQFDTDCDTTTQKDIPREYVSGDFNGDGLTDVLALGRPYVINQCHEEDCTTGGGFGTDPNGNDVIIDLGDGNNTGGNSVCCVCTPSTISNKGVQFIDLNRNLTTNFTTEVGDLLSQIGKKDQFSTGDFNGDGKTDLLHITEGKLYIYSLSNNNTLSLLWQTIDAGINLDDPLLLGDYNGDGKTDFLDPLSSNSNSFRSFISTGVGFSVQAENQPFTYKKQLWSSDNGVLSGFNLVPVDINGDGKTDIIEYNTVTYEGHTNGSQTIKIYNNRGLNDNNASTDQTVFTLGGTTTRNGNLKHYPIPIFLTSNQPNKNLDFASISNQWITSFSFTKDHREDVLLRSVKNNGVEYTIDYSGLDANDPLVYQVSNESVYPNVDIKNAPGTKVVTEIKRMHYEIPTLTKSFTYYGAVYNAEGLGFLGFKGVARSNWHTSISDKIYNVYKFDTDLRGAITAIYSQANHFDFNVPTSNYISKTTTQYASSLASNKVFKLWTTSTLTQNALDGTYSNISYQYDVYNNPTNISTTYAGGSTNKNIVYANNPGWTYFIGRPTSIFTSSTIGGDTFTSEEQFLYSGYLLTQKKTKGHNTAFDVETYEYDIYGNIISQTSIPNGETPRQIFFEYDNSGRFLTKEIDLEGLEVSYDYNQKTGSLLKETNPFGQETNYEYDVWNRLTKATDYLGKSATTSYDEFGNNYYKVSVVDDQNSESEVIYDPLKRIIKVSEKDILGQWVHKSYEYDNLGRVSKESEPYIGNTPSQWNEVTYDFYSRPITQTLYTGRVINMSYNGMSVTVDDGVKTVTTTKDGMGNILNVTDPGGTINYTYYGNGGIKSTENSGSIISVEQDGWGRKTKLTDPSAGIFEYSYNGYGELLSETNPKGTTNYTYDAIGKLTEEHIIGDNTDMLTQYTYHSVNKMVSHMNVTSSDGNNASYAYTYDSNHRLIETTETNPHANFAKEYTYDTFGRINTEKYFAKLLSNNKTSTKEIRNEYQNGALKTIIDVNTNQNLWSITGVNAKSQLTSTLLGNDLQSSNSYDNYGYLTNKVLSKNNTATSQVLMNLTTSFDVQRGTLNSRSNSLFSWSETFEYDNLDRLLTFNDNESNNTLSYDDLGRITSNSTIGDYNYSGTSYQLSNIDLNNQGDLYYRQNNLQQIKYNAFKKPFEINEEGKEKIGFQYNTFMGRSHMFYGGIEDDIYQRNKRKHYAADGSMEISYSTNTDTNIDTTLFITYIGGDAYNTPVIWRSEQQSFSTNEDYYYLHRDYLGSIILITNADGNAKEKRHFDAWGNIVKLTDGDDVELERLTFLDRGYTGHEHLQGVKLIHMNGRLYDPKLKRFLSPDNYIQNPSNTQNYNRYSYVLNNPLMYTDPTGETGEDPPGLSNVAQIGLGGAIAGGLSSINWDGLRFNDVDNWVTKNILRPIQKSRIGSWIGGWFKKRKKKSPPRELNTYNNLTSDPVAGTSSGNSISLYDAGGWIVNRLGSMFSDPIGHSSLATVGLVKGVRLGANHTWRFIKSLGSLETWKAIPSAMTPNQFVSMGTVSAIQNTEKYIGNIPNMSSYHIAHDVGLGLGYAGEKAVEGAILRRIYINGGLTSADGFLLGGIKMKAPFNIPVQRFGNMSLNRPDFWGLRIGGNKFANRVFAAIKPEWNSLTQLTKGVIPKGTPIKLGIIGPQGWRFPGGSMQFISYSKSIIKQSTKLH